jgi:hypothetical protein
MVFRTTVLFNNLLLEIVMGPGFQVWEERYAKAVSLEKARPHTWTDSLTGR